MAEVKKPATKTAAKPVAPATAAKPVAAKAPATKAVSAKTTSTAVKVKPAAEKSVATPSTAVVTFEVKLYDAALGMKELFLVGNIAALGVWDVKKGVALKTTDGVNFCAKVKFPMGTLIQYKVCNAINWTGVEKGMWGEELANHELLVSNDTTSIIGVSRWREE